MMVDHVHFDLASAEKAIRAGYADMNAAERPSTMDGNDRLFVDVQIDLQETQVQFALWQLRQLNNGIEIDMLIQAVGGAIGTMLWGFVDNTDYEPTDVLDAILSQVGDTISRHVDGQSTPGMAMGTTSLESEQGGRA